GIGPRAPRTPFVPTRGGASPERRVRDARFEGKADLAQAMTGRPPMTPTLGALRICSVHLDARGLDDLTPLLDFRGNVCPELGGRHQHRLCTQTGKLRLDRRIREHGVDLFVE